MNNIIEKLHTQIFGDRIHPKFHKYIAIGFGSLCIWGLRNIFWRIYQKMHQYPEGAHGIPIFGCLLSFGIDPSGFLRSIAEKYGAISYIPFIFTNVIFISDPKLLKQLYHNEKFNHRPKFANPIRPAESFGLSHDLLRWRQGRQWALSAFFSDLNDKALLQHITEAIDKEVMPIIDDNISNYNVWYPAKYAEYVSFNHLFSVLFGYHVPFKDEFINKFLNGLVRAADGFGVIVLLNFMFGGRIKIPDCIIWHIKYKIDHQNDEMMISWLLNNSDIVIDRKHKSIHRKKSEHKKRTYIDFLISKQKNNEITFNEIMADLELLLAAGTHTSSRTAEYGFFLLAKYADIQEMIYNELMSVLKKHNYKRFNYEIMNELHKFRAFVHEMSRIACVSPLGVPHQNVEQHVLKLDNGKIMKIPKNCYILSNTYYIHRYLDWNNNDNKFQHENVEIHLEYWLDSNDQFRMNKNFILFGTGERQCIGATFAKKTMYAMFALLITKYKFILNKNHTEINQKWTGLFLAVDPSFGIDIKLR